jgi:hypothetical protein
MISVCDYGESQIDSLSFLIMPLTLIGNLPYKLFTCLLMRVTGTLDLEFKIPIDSLMLFPVNFCYNKR